MDHAKQTACDLLYRPKDPAYGEKIRKFQGCPTIAVTPKGRIYLGWYSGGICEPHMENYNLLVYSDDRGETWSEPLLVIPSSKERFVHALDIQLWTDPQGRLHVYWVQNNTEPAPLPTFASVDPKRPWNLMPPKKAGQVLVAVDGYLFSDFRHACWETVSEDPDSDAPHFSEPRFLDTGFLRCKPLVLANGTWLNFNYDQIEDRYGYSVSKDGGKTYRHCYGPKKLSTEFDEGMAYQRKDGGIRFLARTSLGELAECFSYDGGESFSEARLSGIDSPNTRFFVSRTPSGRILLVNNDHREKRTNMTVYLSETRARLGSTRLALTRGSGSRIPTWISREIRCT